MVRRVSKGLRLVRGSVLSRLFAVLLLIVCLGVSLRGVLVLVGV